MAYTALYRKWRPADFDEVKGQDAIVKTLRNQVETGRVGHAYLFCGTRGTGKTSIAKIFAKAVNCQNPQHGNPCNECAICRAVAAGASLNVIEIDAASNNGVDNIRDIREQVEFPPTEGHYKVYIIDEVHMLSLGAFNALLKTLEEPPEYVIFILATTEVNKIPITILSRCQRYDFKRISVDTIADRLEEMTVAENIETERRALLYLAKAADGSMRDAVSLLDRCLAFHYGKPLKYDDVLSVLGAVDTGVFSDMIKAVYNQDISECMRLVDDMMTAGREVTQFVNDLIWYVRNLLLSKNVTADVLEMSEENYKKLREDAEHLGTETLMYYIRMLSELLNQLRYASQKRILLETTLMRLAKPESTQSLDAVMARMEQIERKMSEGTFVQALQNKSGVQNPAEESHPDEPPKIVLTKPQYEDLMLIKKEWKNIVAGLDAMNRAALSDTYVMPHKDAMNVVFETQARYMIGSREDVLKQIHDIVAQKYEKDIVFRAIITNNAKLRNTVYVTDEDLKQINYEIEVED